MFLERKGERMGEPAIEMMSTPEGIFWGILTLGVGILLLWLPRRLETKREKKVKKGGDTDDEG